jgi:hypothetical protein
MADNYYRCELCGFEGILEPVPPLHDANCPRCNSLLFPSNQAQPAQSIQLSAGQYLVSKVCPRCGSNDYKRRRPKTFMAFAFDRICNSCGTRYAPPTPLWGAVLFILTGVVVLGVVGYGLVDWLILGHETGKTVALFFGIISPLGIVAIVFGIWSLTRLGKQKTVTAPVPPGQQKPLSAANERLLGVIVIVVGIGYMVLNWYLLFHSRYFYVPTGPLFLGIGFGVILKSLEVTKKAPPHAEYGFPAPPTTGQDATAGPLSHAVKLIIFLTVVAEIGLYLLMYNWLHIWW